MGKALHGLGRICARWPWAVLGAWVIIVLGIIGMVRVFGAETSNDLELPGTESQQVQDLLSDRFPPQQNGTNPIVFHVETGKAERPGEQAGPQPVDQGPAARLRTSTASRDRSATPGRPQAWCPRTDGRRSRRCCSTSDPASSTRRSRRTSSTPPNPPRTPASTWRRPGRSAAAVRPTHREQRGRRDPVRDADPHPGARQPRRHGACRSSAAASASSSASGWSDCSGTWSPMPATGATLATMIGLGVGIDYALFLITRHQDQLAAGLLRRGVDRPFGGHLGQRHRVRRGHRRGRAGGPPSRGDPPAQHARARVGHRRADGGAFRDLVPARRAGAAGPPR